MARRIEEEERKRKVEQDAENKDDEMQADKDDAEMRDDEVKEEKVEPPVKKMRANEQMDGEMMVDSHAEGSGGQAPPPASRGHAAARGGDADLDGRTGLEQMLEGEV